jgi:hypothetical protein
MKTPYEMLRDGGNWLAAVRGRVQTMFHNGSTVTWNTNDVLSPPATIANIEELGSYAAAAVANDMQKQLDASQKLCEIYFRIAASAIGELETRAKRDAMIAEEVRDSK